MILWLGLIECNLPLFGPYSMTKIKLLFKHPQLFLFGPAALRTVHCSALHGADPAAGSSRGAVSRSLSLSLHCPHQWETADT